MSFVSKINANPPAEELRNLYDQWASTYHADLVGGEQHYVAPALTAQAVLKTLGTDHIDPSLEILDAGCGTGWVGEMLAQVGAKIIDGWDISPGMLKVARDTGVYRDLNVVDLTKPLDKAEPKYDAITCIGTFLIGHVGPEALPEFLRVMKTGAVCVATVRDNVWIENGFKDMVEKLVHDGKIKLISCELSDYRAEVKAYFVIFSKL